MKNRELETMFMNMVSGGRINRGIIVKVNNADGNECSVNGIEYYIPYYVALAQRCKEVLFKSNKMNEVRMIEAINFMGSENFFDVVLYGYAIGLFDNRSILNKARSLATKLSNIKPSSEYNEEVERVSTVDYSIGEEVRKDVRRAYSENVVSSIGASHFTKRGVPVKDEQFINIVTSLYKYGESIGHMISWDFGVNASRLFGISNVKKSEIQSNINFMKKAISNDDIHYLIKANLVMGRIKVKDVSKILSCEI